MTRNPMEPTLAHTKTTIRELYPNLSEEQLKELEETLRRYVEVALQIHQDPEHFPEGLDRSDSLTRMKERSKSHLSKHG